MKDFSRQRRVRMLLQDDNVAQPIRSSRWIWKVCRCWCLAIIYLVLKKINATTVSLKQNMYIYIGFKSSGASLRIITMDRNCKKNKVSYANLTFHNRSNGGQDFCSRFLMFSIFSRDITLITDCSFLIWTELMTLLQLICDPVKWVISIIQHNWCLVYVQNTNLGVSDTTLIFWIHYANKEQRKKKIILVISI